MLFFRRRLLLTLQWQGLCLNQQDGVRRAVLSHLTDSAMPAFFMFTKENTLKDFPAISSSMAEAFGCGCYPLKDGKKTSRLEGDAEGTISGSVHVSLPDLTPEEGEPVVQVEAMPRLDRSAEVQSMIDEIVEQDAELGKVMNENSFDIIISCDEGSAAMDAASSLAYVIASEAGTGILIPAFEEEDDDTLWFDDAEDFAEAAFGAEEGDEDEDEDLEEGELEDEDEKK